MTLKERAEKLQKKSPEIEKILISAAKSGTFRAIEKASDLTPPTQNDLRGTNTRSGEMKQHWVTDSDSNPKRNGSEIVTQLNNNKEYSSYVNDGHRMNRHFVPGLYVNPISGLLEYNPSKNVGIVVGTKTSYVPGLHMVDAAKNMYEKTVKSELKKIQEVFD